MEIIIVEKTKEQGGYQARVHKGHTKSVFAKTEIEALKFLVERLEKENDAFIR